MGEAKRRRDAADMPELADEKRGRSAYDFPQNRFGRQYAAELEIPEQGGGGLIGLMEVALECAARERKGQVPGSLGCNYVVECGDGKARMGDFNITAIMSPQGPERAASELANTLASLGARRYAFYTNIRPATGDIPDIAVVGCEPGNTLGWVFDDKSFVAAGPARPVPRQITTGIVSWFTGLLDNMPRPDPEALNAELNAMHRREVGDGASLMVAAKEHIRAVAHTKAVNKNALVFDGTWRGHEGIHVVAFNDEIFQDRTITSQPVIIIVTNLSIAGSRNALLVEEASVSAKFSSIKQRAAMFKISAMSQGRVLKEGWFEAMRTAGGEPTIAMRGNAKAGEWWTEPDAQRHGLAAFLHYFLQENTSDTTDKEDLQHSTEVADMKMRRHRMTFKRAGAP